MNGGRVLTAGLLALLLLRGPAVADVPKNRTLHLLLVNPQASSLVAGAERLRSEALRLSHGRLNVEVSSDGQWQGHKLGELAILKAVHDGEVDMAVITTSPLANYDTALQILDTPFLFDTYEQVDQILDGPDGTGMLASLPKSGLRGLAFFDTGFRVLALRKPWQGIHGLRIRVMESPLYQVMMKLLGAVPVPAGIDKVYGMLKSGYVDGVDVAYPTFFHYHMYESCHTILESRHCYAAKVVLINEYVYDHLGPDEIDWLSRAASVSAASERKLFRDEERATRARCASLGVTITPLSAEDKQVMMRACRPMHDSLARQLQEPWQQALLKSGP